MKKLFFSGLAMVAIGLAAFSPTEDLPLGSSIPKADVKMKDVSGKEISLKDAVQKNGLLVMFSCNTCPWVIKNQGRTNEIAKYAMDQEVGVVLINSNEGQRDAEDSYDAMVKYAGKQGYKWYYTVDENSVLADAFGAKRTPEVFLFDKNGKLVYHGAIDDNPNDGDAVKRKHLKEAIDEAVGGKEVSVKTSRSQGCGIKRKA